MNLFSTSRPFLPSGQKAWQRGDKEIGNLELFPLASGEIELSIYLPLKEAKFKSKKFSITIPIDELPFAIHEFILDPESFCEENFYQTGGQFIPDLRNEEKEQEKKYISNPQLKNLVL